MKIYAYLGNTILLYYLHIITTLGMILISLWNYWGHFLCMTVWVYEHKNKSALENHFVFAICMIYMA